MTVWFVLSKNVVLCLLRLNVLLSQQNGVWNPQLKDGAVNWCFARPPELQVCWSIAPQIALADLSASRDAYELCGHGCLLAPWGRKRLGGPAGLQSPALGTYQEGRVWLAGTEKLAVGPVECHDPRDSFLPPSFPLHPADWVIPRVVSQSTRQGVCVWQWGCCCFAFQWFFACGSLRTCLPAAFLTVCSILWFTISQAYEPARAWHDHFIRAKDDCVL